MVNRTKAGGLSLPLHGRDEDAVFMGWQTAGGGKAVALYNVTAAGHPSFGSTVTEKSLLKLNLQVPQTPLLPPGE
jgi:hypothetical protein